MTRVLVTGATGLIGSNVCVAALGEDCEVRALVRAQARADELEALGVEIFRGDITDRAAVLAAADGCEYCVHCAALVVGGPRWPYAAYEAVNVTGTANVLDAAEHHGIARTICLSTTAAFDRSQTLTEDVRPLPDRGGADPYAATKLLAYEDTMRRAAAGLDVVTVLPGGYGPAPTLGRAVVPPGLNSQLIAVLRRPPDPMPAYPTSPILAADTGRSCVAALRRGIAGELYLLTGRPEDLTTSVGALNLALEIAERPYRVRALTSAEMEAPDVLARWGPSQIRAATQFADPPVRNTLTIERLGHHPTPLRPAMEQTVAWLLENDFV
jgi:dihydroflavonol-4-reductase